MFFQFKKKECSINVISNQNTPISRVCKDYHLADWSVTIFWNLYKWLLNFSTNLSSLWMDKNPKPILMQKKNRKWWIKKALSYDYLEHDHYLFRFLLFFIKLEKFVIVSKEDSVEHLQLRGIKPDSYIILQEDWRGNILVIYRCEIMSTIMLVNTGYLLQFINPLLCYLAIYCNNYCN